MMTSDELVVELERLLGYVNAELKRVLPIITDPAFTDSDVRKAVQEAERLSRWRRSPLPGDKAGLDFAITRAQVKAKEYGEPFVVVEKEDGSAVVVVSKARLLKERPFGLAEKDVIYESDKART